MTIIEKNRQIKSIWWGYIKYLEDDISYLIERNILLVGIKPKCPHCVINFGIILMKSIRDINARGVITTYN